MAAGGVVAWWLYLALPDPMPGRVAAALAVAVAGVALGVLRIGDATAREWMVRVGAFALRCRVLVTGEAC